MSTIVCPNCETTLIKSFAYEHPCFAAGLAFMEEAKQNTFACTVPGCNVVCSSVMVLQDHMMIHELSKDGG